MIARRLVAAGCLVPIVGCHALRPFVFHCERGVDIRAVFVPDSVRLTFPDRAVELPRALSADGARYSNGDLTFWNKGQDAFVQEGDSTIYHTCHTNQTAR